MLEETLDKDLKSALLARDTLAVNTLRGLKSAILYAKVASGKRTESMADDALAAVLQKEAKRRQESADLYRRGGSPEKAELELAEKRIIERYLPKKLSEAEVARIVDEVITTHDSSSEKPNMGQVIGIIKQRVGVAADGALIARLVKERLAQ